MKSIFAVLLVGACAALVFGLNASGKEPSHKDKGAGAASPSAKQADPKSPDLATLRASATAFREAFNRADAKAVAALWTKDGQYVDELGQRYEGRAAIEKEYADFFAAHPGTKIQIAITSLRLLSADAAMEEGRTSIEPAPEGSPAASEYTAVHIKTDGKWLMSSVHDRRAEIASHFSKLEDLDWLVGSWSAEEHGAKMEAVCQWVANKSFMQRTYSVKQNNELVSSGIQIIGWNPQTECVQSWTFTSDGGHALGIWSPHETGWTVETRHVGRRNSDQRREYVEPSRGRRLLVAVYAALGRWPVVARSGRDRAETHIGALMTTGRCEFDDPINSSKAYSMIQRYLLLTAAVLALLIAPAQQASARLRRFSWGRRLWRWWIPCQQLQRRWVPLRRLWRV